MNQNNRLTCPQIFVVEINRCIFLTDSNVLQSPMNAEFEWLADRSGHSTHLDLCHAIHTNSSMPLTKLLSSEARKTTALAISSGVPTLPMGY